MEVPSTRKIRQVHFWLADDDYRYLVALAQAEELSVGAALRRMIRTSRRQTNVVPAPWRHPPG